MSEFTRLYDESLVFRGQGFEALRFPISSPIQVRGFDDKGQPITYMSGSDYVVKDGRIARTAGSRIPDFGTFTYTKTTGDNFEFNGDPRNPPKTVPYQVFVTYDADAFTTTIKPKGELARSGNVTCLGDSISSGSDTASSFYRTGEPESFCQLLDEYFPNMQISNRAVPGSQIRSVWLDYDEYVKPSDDILLIAFGMNDHSNGPDYLQRFEDRIEEVSLRAIKEGKQVVLIGFPQRNKLWDYEDPASTIAYNEAIEEVALENGIPFVDIYSAFESMGDNRHVIERMFGDFIHHPNGYGHRIYFSKLLPYFLQKPTRSTEFPEYIVGEWSEQQ